MGRVCVCILCMLCVGDSEECERGVGAGVNDTLLSETLQVVGFTEVAVTGAFRL